MNKELQRCFVIEIMKLVCKKKLELIPFVCTFSAKDIAIVIIIIVVHLLNVAIAIIIIIIIIIIYNYRLIKFYDNKIKPARSRFYRLAQVCKQFALLKTTHVQCTAPGLKTRSIYISF